MKGTPVFAIEHPNPCLQVICHPHTKLLYRRPLLHERVMVPFTAQIHGIPAHVFWEIAKRTQFGGIRYKMGSEMYANRRFLMDDRLPDGLKQGKVKGRAVFGV